MNANRFNFLIFVTLLLTSCASTPIHPVAVIGPSPADGQAGYLQVFSPVEEREDWDRPVYYRLHVGYKIFTPEGKLVRELKNAAYSSQEDTLELVSLPTGQYQVKINGKQVTVEVSIKPGRTTVVHLDGSWQPPGNVKNNDLVRLPDGKIVGWRANLPETSSSR